jgi:Ca2+/Na+ antiporter
MGGLFGAIVEFIILVGLIVAISRFLLYKPAKGISHRLKFDEQNSGQLLGYLTSAPELVTTIFVALNGFMLTVAFNILSSNVINVVLALSAALVFGKARLLFSRKLWREQLLIVASIVVPVLLLLTDQVESAWVIPVFLLGYVGYLVVLKRISQDSPIPTEYGDVVHVEADGRLSTKAYVAVNGLIIVIALAGLYFLGNALGGNVQELGTTYGVSEIILGIAIGVVTSLPELTTFFASYAWHRANDSDRATEEVTHNLLASNVSNLLLIQTIGLAIFIFFAVG